MARSISNSKRSTVRRSNRPQKKRVLMVYEQPSTRNLTPEERQSIEMDKIGKELVDKHLKPAGWAWAKRRKPCSCASAGFGYVLRAPGITKGKEIVNVNMFLTYHAIVEQYEKDGNTMDQILARVNQSMNPISEAAAATPLGRKQQGPEVPRGLEPAGQAPTNSAPSIIAPEPQLSNPHVQPQAEAVQTSAHSAPSVPASEPQPRNPHVQVHADVTLGSNDQVAVPVSGNLAPTAVAAPDTHLSNPDVQPPAEATFGYSDDRGVPPPEDEPDASNPPVDIKEEHDAIDLSSDAPPAAPPRLTLPRRLHRIVKAWGYSPGHFESEAPRRQLQLLEEDFGVKNAAASIQERISTLENLLGLMAAPEL